MNGGDTKLSELSDFYKMQKSQLDFLILPVTTLVGLDDVIGVVTSWARFARIISVLGSILANLNSSRNYAGSPSFFTIHNIE